MSAELTYKFKARKIRNSQSAVKGKTLKNGLKSFRQLSEWYKDVYHAYIQNPGRISRKIFKNMMAPILLNFIKIILKDLRISMYPEEKNIAKKNTHIYHFQIAESHFQGAVKHCKKPCILSLQKMWQKN